MRGRTERRITTWEPVIKDVLTFLGKRSDAQQRRLAESAAVSGAVYYLVVGVIHVSARPG